MLGFFGALTISLILLALCFILFLLFHAYNERAEHKPDGHMNRNRAETIICEEAAFIQLGTTKYWTKTLYSSFFGLDFMFKLQLKGYWTALS